MTPEYTQEYLEHMRRQLEFKEQIVCHIRGAIEPDPNNYVYDQTMYQRQLENADLLAKLNMDIQEMEWTILMLESFLS